MLDQHTMRGFGGDVVVRDAAQAGILAIGHLDAATAQRSRVAFGLQSAFGTQGLVLAVDVAPQHPAETNPAAVIGQRP